MERVRKAPDARLLGGWTVLSAKGNIKNATWPADAEEIVLSNAQKIRGVEMPSMALVVCKSGRVYSIAYAVREATKPKGIDFIPIDSWGPKDPILHGIYQFDGDTLKLCVSTAGTGRPKDFEESNERVVLVLQRSEIVRAIDLKGFQGESPKNDFRKPVKITDVEELSKVISDQTWRRRITAQVDFEKQHLLYFAWGGSGQDTLSFRVAKSSVVVFLHHGGVSADYREHFHLFAISKDATWSVESNVLPPVLEAKFQGRWKSEKIRARRRTARSRRQLLRCWRKFVSLALWQSIMGWNN